MHPVQDRGILDADRRRWSVLVGAVLAVGALVPMANANARSLPFDDAYISFSYAARLASGHGLRLSVGSPPVEAFSDPLWVALLAVGKLFGVAIPTWARVLNIALIGVIGGATARLVRRLNPEAPAWMAVGTAALVVFIPATTYDAVGGLETLLFAALFDADAAVLPQRLDRAPGPVGGHDGRVPAAGRHPTRGCRGVGGALGPDVDLVPIGAPPSPGRGRVRPAHGRPRAGSAGVLRPADPQLDRDQGGHERHHHQAADPGRGPAVHHRLPARARPGRAGRRRGPGRSAVDDPGPGADARGDRAQLGRGSTVRRRTTTPTSATSCPCWPRWPPSPWPGSAGWPGPPSLHAPSAAATACSSGPAAWSWWPVILVGTFVTAYRHQQVGTTTANEFAVGRGLTAIPQLFAQDTLSDHGDNYQYGVAKLIDQVGHPHQVLATDEVGAVSYYTDLRIVDLYGLADRHIAERPGPPGSRVDPAYVFAQHPTFFSFRLTGCLCVALANDAVYLRDPRIFAYRLDRLRSRCDPRLRPGLPGGGDPAGPVGHPRDLTRPQPSRPATTRSGSFPPPSPRCSAPIRR